MCSVILSSNIYEIILFISDRFQVPKSQFFLTKLLVSKRISMDRFGSVMFTVYCLSLALIPSIFGTFYYVSAQKTREKYKTLTDCRLLSKNYTEDSCFRSSRYSDRYTCYNEFFSVSYDINNWQRVTSTIETKKRDQRRNVEVRCIGIVKKECHTLSYVSRKRCI